MYHLTTASEHEQLAFTALESETERYASQLVYSKDISTLESEALIVIFSGCIGVMQGI